MTIPLDQIITAAEAARVADRCFDSDIVMSNADQVACENATQAFHDILTPETARQLALIGQAAAALTKFDHGDDVTVRVNAKAWANLRAALTGEGL